jgi:hypothetical protein
VDRLKRGDPVDHAQLQRSWDSSDIFALARMADKWSKPKEAAHMPNLSAKENETAADKAKIIAGMFPCL